ncbi:Flp pilus assembly protein TadD [Sphingomonas sp. SORGH_AS789]|nr:Flp pilus assembly protein TadD [Sphingomonas sp. SORGH_AS_0789]MDR6151126.1 Flp pilus assembly protein TadD [Sphingomonas sp. SORGH_AS_0742]
MTMMTTIRTLMACSIGALMIGGGLTGCTSADRRTARLADGAGHGGEAQATAALADRTRRVLAQRDGEGAVALAERLVAADPHQAGYRALLGQSYLQAGRFASARQAFTDALQLDPKDGRAALNLSLAMIVGGNGAGARAMLERHAAMIPATDLGLAVALAGSPGDGIRILTAAAREPGASVKTRQNLALALALAGQWDMARMAALADMAPADVEARMREWADFVATTSPADQVSALLGIRPAVDSGQPLALALNAAPSAAVVEDMVQALPRPADTDAPVAMAAKGEDLPPPGPLVEQAAIIDAEPTPYKRATRMAAALVTTPALLRRAEERRVAAPKGEWNVQIGAFGREDGAQRAWALLTRQFAGLSDYAPQSGTIRHSGGELHRLSVGGLSRDQADALCGRYRRTGGACFVRRQADDRMAHWARPGIGLASL